MERKWSSQSDFDHRASGTQSERINHYTTERTEITYKISMLLFKINNYLFNDVTIAILVYMYKMN